MFILWVWYAGIKWAKTPKLLQCVINGDCLMYNMRFFTLILTTLVIMAPIAVNGDFLCGFLSFLGTDWPCRMSCKIQGYVSKVRVLVKISRVIYVIPCYHISQTNGTCEGPDCGCSSETILDEIKEHIAKFGDEVNSWNITKDVKRLVNRAQCGISKKYENIQIHI